MALEVAYRGALVAAFHTFHMAYLVARKVGKSPVVTCQDPAGVRRRAAFQAWQVHVLVVAYLEEHVGTVDIEVSASEVVAYPVPWLAAYLAAIDLGIAAAYLAVIDQGIVAACLARPDSSCHMYKEAALDLTCP